MSKSEHEMSRFCKFCEFQEVDSVLHSLKPKVGTDSLSRNGKIENREDTDYMERNIMPLLKALHEQEKLPCLIFQ